MSQDHDSLAACFRLYEGGGRFSSQSVECKGRNEWSLPKRDRNRFGSANPLKISNSPSTYHIATCDDVRCPHVSSDCDEFYIVLQTRMAVTKPVIFMFLIAWVGRLLL